MSGLDPWLDEQPDEGEEPYDPDPTDIFVQLDCLALERRTRRDPHWSPPGEDPENLIALVEDHRARGLLRPPGQRRKS